MSDLFRQQLIAARASCVAAVTALDAVIAQIPDPTTAPPRPVASKDPEACEHPEEKRLDAATMGDPNRWVCGACGENGRN